MNHPQLRNEGSILELEVFVVRITMQTMATLIRGKCGWRLYNQILGRIYLEPLWLAFFILVFEGFG